MKIIINNTTLEITVVHSCRARHLRISIDREKNVSLIIPRRATEEQGIRFLNSRREWVEKTLSRIKPRKKQLWEFKFEEETQIFFFGLPHNLQFTNEHMYPYINKVQSSKFKVQSDSLKFKIHASACSASSIRLYPLEIHAPSVAVGEVGCENSSIDKTDNAKYQIITPGKRHIFDNFLSNKLREHIYGFAFKFCKTYGFAFKDLKIKNMKSRWGSCSRLGNLNFSLRLVHYSSEVINYVVVHELCHIREMNHSRKFWSLVAEYCPNYKTYIKLLK